jgi:hypothetical protein
MYQTPPGIRSKHGRRIAALIVVTALVTQATVSAATGPLAVLSSNPRYFTDGSGKVVYLTGSHTWESFYDWDPASTPFDYAAYISFLDSYDHNFIKLWAWEQTRSNAIPGLGTVLGPEFPWLRTGPGVANDGLPKFDFTQSNPAFYQRLLDRVSLANDRGIYVQVMLFEGWELTQESSHWQYHPFNPSNNVQGLNGNGVGYHTLANPAITQIQEEYVRRVVDTLNALPNVLYEISNESNPTTADTQWQYRLINFIKSYQSSKPNQHPVCMTWQVQADQASGNIPLWNSAADCIQPGSTSSENYVANPPVSSGAKVIMVDTDHNNPYGPNGAVWVWKVFLRGMYPMYMDPYNSGLFTPEESVRRSLGHTRMYAERVDLASLSPQASGTTLPSSSGYSLSRQEEILTLVFTTGVGANRKTQVSVNLPPGYFSAEWFNIDTAGVTMATSTTSGGGERTFNAPSTGTYALYLKKVPPDTSAPTVTVTNPLSGSTVARNSTVTIRASASDDVSVAKVEFYVDNTLKSTDTLAPYSYDWKVPGSPNKSYTLSAKAYDAQGNATSAGVTVTAK